MYPISYDKLDASIEGKKVTVKSEVFGVHAERTLEVLEYLNGNDCKVLRAVGGASVVLLNDDEIFSHTAVVNPPTTLGARVRFGDRVFIKCDHDEVCYRDPFDDNDWLDWDGILAVAGAQEITIQENYDLGDILTEWPEDDRTLRGFMIHSSRYIWHWDSRDLQWFAPGIPHTNSKVPGEGPWTVI